MTFNKLVKEEISGNTAKSFVAQITRFHRIQGSTMFHEAAEYVKNELLSMGLEDAVIEQFPADGKHKYWTHTSPLGWTVKEAELHMIEPEEKLLCTYNDLPQCLHTFSNGTPKEGIMAELVDVGSGTKPEDYEGKDVKGKFVLATGRARAVHEQAVYKHGAAGVITDTITYEMPNVRESLDIPDAHAYQSIWPTAEELDKATFGFSLSKRQGNALRTLLKNGKTVKLKATVDAKLFAGHEYVVTATIRGFEKPDQEIFLVAHLCHPKPSANDNASGAGSLMEIARTIKTLIRSGKIDSPTRTIRFFWVPETLGTVAYLSSHEDLSNRLIAGINLDMVGQNQELCRSTLCLDRTPDSCPSFLNDYVYDLIEQSVETFDAKTRFGSGSTFRYHMQTFSGGSDHAEFTEATTHAPCAMLLQWPDLFYHTSQDTIDKVSEDSLRRICWMTTVAVLTLANATHEDFFLFAHQTAMKGMARLAKTSGKAIEAILKKKEDASVKGKQTDLATELAKTALYYKNMIEHIVWREQEAVRSVRRFGEHPELSVFIDKHCGDLENEGKNEIMKIEESLIFAAKSSAVQLPAKLKETQAEEEAKKLIPRRLFKGTLSSDLFKKELGEKEYEWYDKINDVDADFDKKMAEILNFADGKRTAYDVTKAVASEYSPTNVEHVLKFLRDLEKIKLIAFQ